MPSTRGQIWALNRRYLVNSIRSPISSLLRIAWPFGLLALFVVLLVNAKDNKDFWDSLGLENSLPFLFLALTIFHCYHFASWLVTDKATGIKSLMIFMGLKRISYYIGNSIFIVATLAPPVMGAAVISMIHLFESSKTSYIAITLIFILFIAHLTGFIFVLSSFITSTSYVVFIFVLLLLEGLSHLLVIWLMENSSDAFQPLVLFVASLSPYESLRIFCSSYTLCKNCDTTKFSDGMVSQPTYLILIAMTFWSILSFAFARWFEEVCPWQTDSAIKSPFYCCQSESGSQELSSAEHDPPPRSKFFERSLSMSDVGIRLSHVTKIYKPNIVVNDVTFNIYKGETTLLLGHNGAGKTTLMNMILGKLLPDKGKISINQSNTSDGISVGVCPQTSVLDAGLNVRQHLELFADIKSSRLTAHEREQHIKETMEDVSLTGHMNKLPSELSGGMQRKLSLAMAFVGKSNVLILDEPSSGLDPDSRVSVWNTIRRYRTDKTVLLSTQHMEEADYLGDRIAVMNAGKIICCGSSTFLTDLFGGGYKLRVECHHLAREQVLTFVRKYFPSAKLAESEHFSSSHTSNKSEDPMLDMVIELVIDDKSKDWESNLINLLENIERDPSSSRIKSYSLKSSSIEDVMLHTGKSSPSEPGDSVRVTLTSMSGQREALANPMRAPNRGFCDKQLSLLQALVIKHMNTYMSDLKNTLFFRVTIVVFGAYMLVTDILGHNLIRPVFNPNLIVSLMIMYFIYNPASEQTSKFKIVQLTSNANLVVYWLSQLLVDLITVAVQIISVNIFLAFLIDAVYLVPKAEVFILVSIAVFLFGVSGALLAYILSTLISNSKKAIGYYVILFSLSVMASLFVTLLGLATKKDMQWLQTIFSYLFVTLFPTDALVYVLYGLSTKCYLRSIENPECLELNTFSPVIYGFIALSGQVLVYATLLYIIERENYDLSWYFRLKNILYCCKSPAMTNERREIDNDVSDESAKAMRVIGNVPRDNYSLVVSNLNKSYIKGVKVVDNLSFTVNKSECFGLLGVNGAGKSSTFAMLVGDSKPDSGKIWMNGLYLSKNVDNYRSRLAYDPQSNPELLMSSADALYLMARLRNINEPSIPMLVNSMLELLDMSEHSKKRVSDLSGGTKRKLALGMSLIGTPLMLALDEPTAGIDPVARRGIWQLLRVLRIQSGSSIVISSHAMEECEAICDRISIMARGRLRCIGTFLHLRSKFSRGCRIRVQFSVGGMVNASNVLALHKQMVADLSERLMAKVGNSVKLTDTNVNSATFNVLDNSVKRSLLFKTLRQCKEKYPNMSYAINDSSLEDIFISLAREQQQLETVQQSSV